MPPRFHFNDVSLCPDGVLRVYASVGAAPGLRDLNPDVRQQVIRRLCDIAEIAFLSIGSPDHWDEATLLRLKAADTVVLYSVDANGVLVHHVLESRAA